ncbi:MAG: hypothetical protein RI973_2346, partial [Bacteroidota bacterium]
MPFSEGLHPSLRKGAGWGAGGPA